MPESLKIGIFGVTVGVLAAGYGLYQQHVAGRAGPGELFTLLGVGVLVPAVPIFAVGLFMWLSNR